MLDDDAKLRILFLSAEVDPYAKTGGLADVAGSLPEAIRRLGHDIRVVMPAYGRIDKEQFGLKLALESFQVPLGGIERAADVYKVVGDGVPVYFIDNAEYFDRESIYGYEDDADRFIFFCRAALAMCKKLDWQPSVYHCNDWHTAIIPNWTHTVFAEDSFFKDAATVFTIHNLQYQGIFGWRALQIAGIADHGFIVHPEVAANLNDAVDLMARGIVFADVVNTVSPTYAEEILTKEFGEGLHPILRDRRDTLFGILNGIDMSEWDPTSGEGIVQAYAIDSLNLRVENKLALQGELDLPVDGNVPVIGMITRLADQKGLDLLEDTIDNILELDVQFVLLGTGEQHYHNLFLRVKDEHPDKVGLSLTFNAPLARKIYSGSDMFLMPSRFEPCGLGQMIAMRYGSVPIVRAVGGLADTVADFDPRTGKGNGFVFEEYEPWALFAAVVRATANYRHVDAWRQLQANGMRADFSWDASAREYVELYRRAQEVQHEPRIEHRV